MGTTHFKGNLDVGGNLSVGDSGVLQLPSASSAPSSPSVGDAYYNSTTGKVMMYQETGWTSVDGTAAASLDAAYNGGATIAVDGGAVTLTDSQTGSGGGLLITKSGVVTGSDDASVLHINSTADHDTSGDIKFMEISVASESCSGSIYGIEIEMNANTDSGITITKGAMTLTDGALTLTSGNLTLSSGNLTMTGTLAVTGAMTISSSITAQGAIIIDANAAECFLIRENGDTADVFTIDTTQDAGDTTAKIESKTTTGIALHVDSDTTTGSAVLIDGDAITTGDALLISVASGTMGATGAAISVIDSSNADREVFAVRDDGSVYMYGTAEGTTATQTVKGDMVISDGDLTISGGEVALTSDANAAGLVIVNNTVTTANSLVDVSSTSITTGALMRLNANCASHSGEVLEVISAAPAAGTATGISVTMPDITTGAATGISVVMAKATTTAKGISVTMDKITAGDMLYLDAGGGTLNGGFYINCNDDNSSDFTVGNGGATVITGVAAGTAALTITAGDLVITDSDASTISSVNGTTSLLTLDNEGGVIGSDAAVLDIDAGGAVASGGNLLRVAATGTPNSGAIGMEFVGGGKDLQALYIDVDPTVASAVLFHSQGALAADKATLELVSDVASCDADSSVLRVTQDSTTGVAFCMTLVQDDVSEPFINFECTAATGNSIDETNDTEGTAVGFLRIAVNGTDRYLSYYAAPTVGG